MKKIKMYMAAAALVMSLFVLAACGRSDNNNQSPTQNTTSATSGADQNGGSGGTNGTSGTGAGTNETGTSGWGADSTTGSGQDGYGADESSGSGAGDDRRESRGVLDEMEDDIEKGVDDLMDGPGSTSRAAD